MNNHLKIHQWLTQVIVEVPLEVEVTMLVLWNLKIVEHLLDIHGDCYLLLRYLSRLLHKSGPRSKTLFKDTPWNLADESNTIRTLSGFLGWYTVNISKYHRSNDKGSSGANSSWWFMNSLSMNPWTWSYLSWFHFKRMSNDLARLRASDLLSG